MSDPNTPKAQDEQDPQSQNAEEITQDELEDVAGGANNNCNGICPAD